MNSDRAGGGATSSLELAHAGLAPGAAHAARVITSLKRTMAAP